MKRILIFAVLGVVVAAASATSFARNDACETACPGNDSDGTCPPLCEYGCCAVHPPAVLLDRTLSATPAFVEAHSTGAADAALPTVLDEVFHVPITTSR